MNVLCHAQCKLKKTSRTWWEVCAQCIATWQQAQRVCFLSYFKKLDSSNCFSVLLAIPFKLPNIFFNVTLFGTVWMGVRCAFHTLVVMAGHFVSCYRRECAGKMVYWARGRVGGLTWVCLSCRWLHGVTCLLFVAVICSALTRGLDLLCRFWAQPMSCQWIYTAMTYERFSQSSHFASFGKLMFGFA